MTEGPGEVTRSLWSLRETADVLITELRTTGDVNQGRFDAIVAALDDIADAERVETELRAVQAEADARVAVANAEVERQRVETAAARMLAEESNSASISATEALAASTVQVETLTLRVADVEAIEAELRAELGERVGRIETLQADADAAAERLAELAATAEERRVEGDQLRQSVAQLEGEIHDARQAVATAQQERTDAQQGAERDREARISAERESAESHARADAAETLSAAHQDSARRADEARHGAEARADAAESERRPWPTFSARPKRMRLPSADRPTGQRRPAAGSCSTSPASRRRRAHGGTDPDLSGLPVRNVSPAANEHDRAGQIGKSPMTSFVAVLGAGEGQTGASLPTVTAPRSCDTRYPPICIPQRP